MNELNSQLEKVFSDLSLSLVIGEYPLYIPSTLGKMRNRDAFFLSDDERYHYSFLPPYERSMLSKFVHYPNSVAPFIGRSRSGKSCTVAFIANACLNKENRKQYPDLPYVIHHDMRSYVEEFDQYKSSETIPEKAKAKYRNKFQEAIFNALRRIVGSGFELYRLYAKTFTDITKSDPYRNDEVIDLVNKICFSTNMYRIIDEKNEYDHDYYQEIKDIINKYGSSSKHRLILTMLPLWWDQSSLYRQVKELILVLDNIDAHYIAIQNSIVHDLRDWRTSALWNSRQFKIILTLRYTTYSAHIDGYEPMKPELYHLPIDPVELAFYKLGSFILNPEASSESYKNIQDVSLKESIYYKLLALWRHLNDREGTFQQLFRHIAGTNILNAMTFLQNWCKSIYCNPSIKRTGTLINYVEYVFIVEFLHELWSAFENAIKHYFNGHKDDLKLDEFAKTISEIFSNNHMPYLFRDAISFESKHPIRNISKTYNQQIAEIILKDILQYWEKHSGFIPLQAKQIQRHLGADIASFISCIKDNMENILICSCDYSTMNGNRIECQNANITCLKKCFIYWFHALCCELQNEYKIYGIPAEISGFIRNIKGNDYHRMLSESLSSQTGISRFIASMIMLNPGTDSANTINIFRNNNEELDSTKLYILYYLKKNKALIMNVLYTKLKNIGYSSEQIYEAIDQMVQPHIRLIYCTINDYELNAETIYKIHHNHGKYHLSEAGNGYYEYVVISPPYIQTYLSKSDILDEKIRDISSQDEEEYLKLSDRFLLVIKEFNVLIASDIERISKYYKDLQQKISDNRLSKEENSRKIIEQVLLNQPTNIVPSLDVYFRSMNQFIDAIQRYSKSVKYSSKARWIDENINEWIKNGLINLQQVYEIFGMVPEDWIHALNYANSCLDDNNRHNEHEISKYKM